MLKNYAHSFHEYEGNGNLQKILRIVYFQIKDRIFGANDRRHSPGSFTSSHDRILEQGRILFMIVYFTTQSFVHFRSDRNQDGGRTGKPGLIIIWTIDLGNRSFKVSKWPILG